MANTKSSSSGKTTVRRIKATDSAAKTPKAKAAKPATVAPAKKKAATKTKATAPVDTATPPKSPLKRLGGYFKGAWEELKQVRWPNRSATWSMTLAVLIFTGFFVALIILLDSGFKWMFEQILR